MNIDQSYKASNTMSYTEEIQTTINYIISEEYVPDQCVFAKIFSQMPQFNFKHTCNGWYRFTSHKWVIVDDIFLLLKLMQKELIQLFEAEVKHNIIIKIIRKLHTNSFMNGILSEYKTLQHDPELFKKLDENTNLLCFKDGVYDLTTNTFRDGCPEDCISLCVNYSYKKYDPSDKILVDINNHFNKLQPDLDMKNCLLTILSTYLSGSINKDILNVFLGESVAEITKLMKYTLGDYFKPMDASFLIGSEKYNNKIRFENKKGVRMCSIKSNTDDPININALKSISHNDTITTYGPYLNPISYIPQFKLMLLCDHTPTILSPDNDMWSRVKIIPFITKFICPETLMEWRQSFMSLLLEYRVLYKIHGLKYPKIILKETIECRKKSDIYFHFITDNLVKTNNSNDIISVTNLNAVICRHKSINDKHFNLIQLRNYLTDNNYTKDPNFLFGYKLQLIKNTKSEFVNKSADELDEIINDMKANNISKIQIDEKKLIVEYKL